MLDNSLCSENVLGRPTTINAPDKAHGTPFAEEKSC